mmetsp:Transcript_3118/g.9070  ORF Transcript_3118/g.9070 Transcript_3118/m.9070 type:complete len:339 (+) Transcript_3118:350-1366(+)
MASGRRGPLARRRAAWTRRARGCAVCSPTGRAGATASRCKKRKANATPRVAPSTASGTPGRSGPGARRSAAGGRGNAIGAFSAGRRGAERTATLAPRSSLRHAASSLAPWIASGATGPPHGARAPGLAEAGIRSGCGPSVCTRCGPAGRVPAAHGTSGSAMSWTARRTAFGSLGADGPSATGRAVAASGCAPGGSLPRAAPVAGSARVSGRRSSSATGTRARERRVSGRTGPDGPPAPRRAGWGHDLGSGGRLAMVRRIAPTRTRSRKTAPPGHAPQSAIGTIGGVGRLAQRLAATVQRFGGEALPWPRVRRRAAEGPPTKSWNAPRLRTALPTRFTS